MIEKSVHFFLFSLQETGPCVHTAEVLNSVFIIFSFFILFYLVLFIFKQVLHIILSAFYILYRSFISLWMYKLQL